MSQVSASSFSPPREPRRILEVPYAKVAQSAAFGRFGQRRRVAAGVLAEPVTKPAYVRKCGSAGGVELRTKAREMCLQPLGVGVAFLVPARAQEGAPLEHFARARDERGQQTELGRCQIERLLVDARDVRLRVHTQAADGGGRLLRRGGRRATQQRADART